MRLKSLAALAIVGGVLLGLNARASAEDYPARQVKIIIAFSPSGAIDILGRFIADKLSKMWGQSVIVENRPGGSGNIGAAAASTAAPDGYTLHFGAQTMSVNVTLSPTTAFDPINSFERTGPFSANARILPERMLAIELPIGPKLISVRPDIRSLMP